MISVFGSSGFIGTRFCQLYSNDVYKIDRNDYVPKSSDVLYLISTIHNYNVFDNPHLDINTNLNVLINVLENCKNKDIVFNFISSWFVYGKADTLPATEESHCNPKGFYSITKRAAEQLIISYCETFNIKYRIFRLANVYGESDPSVSKRKNALQYLINEIINNRDINLYDGGKHIRDFIYIDDVCNAIKLCTEKADINSIINIGNGRPYQFLDLMTYVNEKVNSKTNFIHVKPTNFHNIVQVKNMYLDISKLKNLGFKPKYSIEQGLDKIIEHYQLKLGEFR
jgi:nucleoside-diphosphate-sugar epimerase|tara:strand:+ start:3223 stop:4071 length:849 start_codon:yes stop_codon:yes gene_type:complete